MSQFEPTSSQEDAMEHDPNWIAEETRRHQEDPAEGPDLEKPLGESTEDDETPAEADDDEPA